MQIECKVCGYKTEIEETSYLDNNICILCSNTMVPSIIEKKKEEEVESDNVGALIRETLLNAMVDELQNLGEEKVWENINRAEDMEDKMCLIEAFVEAKYIITREQKS